MVWINRYVAAVSVVALTQALLWGSHALAADGPPVRQAPLQLPEAPEAYREASLSGGPPKDGIPSIDSPKFHGARDAQGYLDDGDVVLGVVRDGTAKAYPRRILVWHEIVNDRLAGQPVSVSYCPLTGSALGFLRGDTTLGVSGRLVNSNLIMYDRATDSAWPQMLGTAVSGPLAGRSLQSLQVTWTTWARWRERYPDTRVLSTDTGHIRDYNRDPYGQYNPRRGGYYAPDAATMFPVMHKDGRFPPKTEFIVVHDGNGAVAFRLAALRDNGVLEGSTGGTRYTAVYDTGLDTGAVFRNPEAVDVTAGQVSFDTGGAVLSGDARSLERVVSYRAMWFAYAAFFPDGDVVE
ncbi:DUF3179 domain-containing protein [Ectothiorhodospiraceae bacterium WFHF3C12]|nr:DUF3179 domain-containing protein [Ectothiorhodospiraceae bacterium WFHF3C12]